MAFACDHLLALDGGGGLRYNVRMNRKEFILSGAGAFFIASAGKAFGADAPSNRVRLALVGCREKGRGLE